MRLLQALLLLSLLAGLPSWAADQGASAVAHAMEHGLDADPQWRRLLHFPRGENQSEVLSAEFFLAKDGRTSPKSELEATLQGFLEPVGNDPDAHPRCRFPARYQWISSRIELPDRVSGIRCPAFESWAQLENLRSASLLMVSGYLGNPASSFGHSLLLLNHGENLRSQRLLDTSVTFGAVVPEHESTFMYVLRGVFGGYSAGFSDKLYYTHDQVYSHSEFRDVWAYELSLDASQRALLAGHLWEIVGKKFQYFFFSKNCAFRMAELVALAVDSDEDPRALLWYLPVELFYALDSGVLRQAQGMDVEHIPSAERTLHAIRRSLSADHRARILSVLSGRVSVAEAIDGLAPQQKAEVLDGLLAEIDYLDAATDKGKDRRVELRSEVLLRRLRLPARSGRFDDPPAMPPPTAAEAPQRIFVGAQLLNGSARGDIRWAPYLSDGLIGAEGGTHELVVLDADFRMGPALDFRLDGLDVIRLRRRELMTLPGESPLGKAWDVRLGLERDTRGDLAGYAHGGIGRVWPASERFLVDFMVDAHVSTTLRESRLLPNMGWLYHGDRGGLQARFSYSISEDPLLGFQVELEARFRVARRWSVSMDARLDSEDQRWGFGLNYYR